MDAFIINHVRTPFHRAHKGALSEVRPEDMVATVVEEMLKRSGVSPESIEDLLLGCAYPEGVQGLNLGRIATYLTSLPTSVPGSTTNRLCGSSMDVIHQAGGNIAMGSGDLFLCTGVETMSLVKRGGWNRDLHPGIEDQYPEAYINMGLTAENLASSHSIDRDRQERFALHSHQKASSAQAEGLLAPEIVQISGVHEDGCIRGGTTLEMMAGLKPAFKEDGSVTAATSSPLTDGASCVMVTSSAFAEENNLQPRARIVATAVAGVGPEVMGIGPVPATRKALDRAGLGLEDIDIIELNEAFAAQSIAVLMDLGLADDDERVNIDGGALAIGHPLGASGARITGKAADLLVREDKELALATMCIGGGMGIATILQRV